VRPHIALAVLAAASGRVHEHAQGTAILPLLRPSAGNAGRAHSSGIQTAFRRATTERAIGEASPNYLHAPEAAGRIVAELPEAKIIVSLSNLADRACSSYLGRVRRGVEKRSVEDALQPSSTSGGLMASWMAIGRSGAGPMQRKALARPNPARPPFQVPVKKH
jgi:hypothetical protein